MRARLCFGSLLLSAVGLFLSSAARADDPPKDPKDAANAAAAQALFDDGVKLMEAGQFADACPKLAASERLDPGAGTLLNLGTCYEKNGQIASAWATFDEAESTARRAAHDDWADRAHLHVVALAPRLERLVVSVPNDAVVPGLKITRDGIEVEATTWGVPIPIDPGVHEVHATAPGKLAWSTTVEMKVEGSLSTVNVPSLADVPAPPPPVPIVALPRETPPPASFWTTQRIIAVSVAGAGVVGIAIGSGLGVAAKSKYDDAINHDCPSGGPQCTAVGVQEGQSAHGLAAGSTVAFVLGGAALAAGAAFFFIPLDDSHPEPSSSAWGIAPSMGPRLAGLTLRGGW